MADRSTSPDESQHARPRRAAWLAVAALLSFGALLLLGSSTAAATAPPATIAPPDTIVPPDTIAVPEPGSGTPSLGPTGPTPGDTLPPTTMPSDTGSTDGSTGNGDVSVTLPDVTNPTPNSVLIILLITVISLVPSLLVLCTAFTRIVIVLSLTRNAIGIPQLPPQQVIVGLSLFLTIFVMGPTFSKINEDALQPLLAGDITTSQAFEQAQTPLREFMLAHTGEDELRLFLDASRTQTPVARDKVPLSALIPAFVLSELKTGFLIGFCIFLPFLIIDLVVSSILLALGMMMLPPSFVSLPFKLLLFVMLDGWALVVGTLLKSYA